MNHDKGYKVVVKLTRDIEYELDTLLRKPMMNLTSTALLLDISAELSRLARKYQKQISE